MIAELRKPRPTMKFVATKSADNLDLQALFRASIGWSVCHSACNNIAP